MQPVPFVDRDTQVNAILEYAAEADAGTGRLVLVEGEAGVGKSTLLEYVEARLPDAAWHWGRARPRPGRLSGFGPRDGDPVAARVTAARGGRARRRRPAR